MPELESAAVEARAKQLAEQDGYVWELTMQPVRRYEVIKGQALVP
jgi:hypothetical protein